MMKLKFLPILALFVATFTFAIPVTNANNAAVTDQSFQCGLTWVAQAETAYTNISSWSYTSSGHATLSCTFQNGSFSNTGPAVKLNYANTDMTCNTFAGVTTHWWAVINSTGGASIQCKLP